MVPVSTHIQPLSVVFAQQVDCLTRVFNDSGGLIQMTFCQIHLVVCFS